MIGKKERVFLSTLSLRRATFAISAHCFDGRFLSTLSLRRATLIALFDFPVVPAISIHALLAESDERANSFPHAPPQISIHALLAESDIRNAEAVSKYIIFLSTLSLRRATNIRQVQKIENGISIHALLAESDSSGFNIRSIGEDFYPRSPCGERRDTESARDKPKEFLSTLSLRRATLQS